MCEGGGTRFERGRGDNSSNVQTNHHVIIVAFEYACSQLTTNVCVRWLAGWQGVQGCASAASRTPLLQQLLARAEGVLPVLEHLLAVLDPDDDTAAVLEPAAGVRLRQGCCPEHDAAVEQLKDAVEAAAGVLSGLVGQLAGQAPALVRRVVPQGAGGLLRAPSALQSALQAVRHASFVCHDRGCCNDSGFGPSFVGKLACSQHRCVLSHR